MPDQITLGTPQKNAPNTCLQDCALIVQTFERAALHDTTEASVFAPMYKQLETTKTFAQTAQKALAGYTISPMDETLEDFTNATQGVVDIGTTEIKGGSLTSISVGNNIQDYLSDTLGSDVMDKLRDCIPCGDRLLSLLELHPSLDFLDALRADVLARFKLITDIIDMLRNFDIYADYCKFLDILGGMCIPDLQRLIIMFMALIMEEMPKFDGDFLMTLIGPIFMPILTMITSLLDQFSLVILSPIDCIIDHINLQIHKLYLELDPENPLQEMSNGLAELNKAISDGKKKIQDKLEFYIGQAKKLLETEMIKNNEFLKVSLKKLNYLRMIAFVVAVILALSKGQLACSKDGESPKEEEIDNFFSNFLNPNLPVTFRLNPDGSMTIDETIPGYEDLDDDDVQQVVITPEEIAQLPSSISERVVELQASLTSPIKMTVPCKFKTPAGESAKIEAWIKELQEESI